MSPPKRVLLAWEHGRNLGHVARLSEVADEMSALGAEVTWALPAHEIKSPFVVARAPRRIAAPRSGAGETSSRRRMHSFADILAELGFTDAPTLQAAVHEWLEVFARLAIDRIVLDYAPAAQLAAVIAGLPAAQVTCGFDAPPPECPVFGIGLRGPMLDALNEAALQQIDSTMSAVSRRLGRDSDIRVRDLFEYPTRWYDCIPETDPYGPRRDGHYVGPLGRLSNVTEATWPPGPESARKVFVYLRSDVQLPILLEALSAAAYRVLCVWPGANEQEASRLRRNGLSLLTTPVDLDLVLAQSDIVVSYGAAATACKALLLGKPQLLLPIEIDKHLIASRIATIGAGRLLRPHATLAEMREAIEALTNNSAALNAAQAVADRYHSGFGGLRGVCTELLLSNAASAPRPRFVNAPP